MLFIFDLDGTVVDSSHRQGAGTLAEWRELNTPENIALDSELPYADVMRDAIQRDRNSVWVCTSRIMGDADFAWLNKRELMPSTIIHRTIKEDNIPAGEFKAHALLRHAKKLAGLGRVSLAARLCLTMTATLLIRCVLSTFAS